MRNHNLLDKIALLQSKVDRLSKEVDELKTRSVTIEMQPSVFDSKNVEIILREIAKRVKQAGSRA